MAMLDNDTPADVRSRLLSLLQVFEPAVSSRIPPVEEVIAKIEAMKAQLAEAQVHITALEQERDDARMRVMNVPAA